jgi:hypothetical protein
MYGAASLRWMVALAAAGADSAGGAAGARVAAPAPPPPPGAEPMLSALPARALVDLLVLGRCWVACEELEAPEAPEAGAGALPLRCRPDMDL